jgi:hypothetical protein
MGLGDNGDAVAAHDALEAEYYQRRDSSVTTRWRLRLKDARDPLEPQTGRQILVGLAVLSVLWVWRMEKR